MSRSGSLLASLLVLPLLLCPAPAAAEDGSSKMDVSWYEDDYASMPDPGWYEESYSEVDVGTLDWYNGVDSRAGEQSGRPAEYLDLGWYSDADSGGAALMPLDWYGETQPKTDHAASGDVAADEQGDVPATGDTSKKKSSGCAVNDRPGTAWLQLCLLLAAGTSLLRRRLPAGS